MNVAIADAIGRLDTLRLHLSRCGKEGDDDRKGLSESVRTLKHLVQKGGR